MAGVGLESNRARRRRCGDLRVRGRAVQGHGALPRSWSQRRSPPGSSQATAVSPVREAIESAPRWPQAVLELATSRALHETRRISHASELLAPRDAQQLGVARLPALDASARTRSGDRPVPHLTCRNLLSMESPVERQLTHQTMEAVIRSRSSPYAGSAPRRYAAYRRLTVRTRGGANL